MPNLVELPSWDEQGRLRVIVETPRGSAFKVRYDAASQAFTFQRPLRDLTYPHDWGFVPGTTAEDGDPLDALVLHEDTTWPGIVVPCEPLAVLRIRDRKSGADHAVQNDRVIAVPSVTRPGSDGPPWGEEKRRVLEEFFRAAGEQNGKRVELLGWGDADEARGVIQRASTPHK